MTVYSPGDGYTTLLGNGIAAELDEWALGTWRESSAYGTDDTRPIYIGPNEPPQAPDERLIVTVHTPMRVAGSRALVETSVGLNYRAEPTDDDRPARNLLDALYRRLDRLGPHTFGAVQIGAVLHQSSGLLGQDGARRYSASATYLFRGRLASVNV